MRRLHLAASQAGRKGREAGQVEADEVLNPVTRASHVENDVARHNFKLHLTYSTRPDQFWCIHLILTHDVSALRSDARESTRKTWQT